MRYDHFTMLPIRAFHPIGGRWRCGLFGGRMTLEGGGKNDSPDPPDYTPMAQASEAAARIGAEQADRVLAESTRQYDRNMEVAQPVIEAQTKMMQSQQVQGDEYYDYWKTKARPVEDALNADAMASGTPQAQEEAAGRAAADVRTGQAAQVNMMTRQGLRYGWSPEKMASMAGSMATGNASAVAGATTAAREKEKLIGTAKRMDVAGLYRGMPGASTGAYGAANNAGNSAVNNSIGVGQGIQAGTNAAAGLNLQGQGLRIQGLNGILNSQTSAYNAGQQSGSDSLGGLGSLIGAGVKAYSAYMTGGASLAASSKELKTDKKPISESVALMGLERIPVEQWDYKKGVEDGGTHVGPYAEDVQKEFGDGAAPDGKAIDLVSMNGITIAALKGLAKKVAGLERIVTQRGGNVIDGEFERTDEGGQPVLPHLGLVRMGG